MNILFIHHVADMYGSSRCLLRLAARLVADGHSVASTLESDGPLREALESAGVTVLIVPDMPALHRKRLTRPAGWVALLRSVVSARERIGRIVAEFKPDLIHSNSAALLPVAGAVARSAGIPHVQHVRESFLEFGFLWVVYRAMLVHYATRVISISDFVAGMFTPGQRAAKVRTIYDGLPAHDFEGSRAEDVAAFMSRYQLQHPLIALVGRIKLKRKGQDLLVKAAARIATKHPGARYVLVGSPFPGNEDHLAALQEMIRDLGLSERVVLTGHLSDPLLALAACDISVMASSTPEPLGNVTIESMALGKPVIGTDCGATRELVRNGVNGRLVPADDPEAMAEALDMLLSNPAMREAMGDCGRADYLARFQFEPHYQAIVELYRESIADQ